MKLTNSDLRQLADLAVSAAREAGQMIARSRPQDMQYKTDAGSPASQVVTETDQRSERLILAALRPTLIPFELGMLTEEQVDDGSRLATDYFWSIDPLDGTLPFIEGVPGYAVSIALVARDGTPWIGVMYDPVEEVLLAAIKGAGVSRDGEPWPTEPQPAARVLSVFADRSFLVAQDRDRVLNALESLAQDRGLQGVEVHATGGAVMNATRVLLNPPACYFKFPAPSGGGSVWDFAATACIFNEVGAVATDIYGKPLDLNRLDGTLMNHRGVLFADDEELARGIRALYPTS